MAAHPSAMWPDWLTPFVEVAGRVSAEQLTRFVPPPDATRRSAVLILFGEDSTGPDLLLIERAHDMREHAGQPAFPGGALDPGEQPAEAALREAAEETGLDPLGITICAQLPDLFLPPSGFVVTPVIAWWQVVSPVRAVDPGEVASVHRVSLATLVDPANRFSVRHPSGFTGPAFAAHGLVVWGFTGGLLDRLLYLAGWERPWDPDDVRELPAHQV